MDDYIKRKPNRLRSYDYSQNGTYFVTICTKDKKCIFWDNAHGPICVHCTSVGEAISLPYKLSEYGKIVVGAIEEIPKHYPDVFVDKYVVMPNHVHLILLITGNDGRIISAPTVSTIIGQTKRYVSKQIGKTIFQRSFHDHIIRSEDDYRQIWQYIDTNPAKWEDDCFYTAQ